MADQSTGTIYLIDRARQFLANHHGRVREEALLAHVFGQRGRTEVWRALLRATLAGADDFVQRDDGTWELRRRLAIDLADYAVIDVETTGLDPHRQRIIDLAVHRYQAGQRTSRWSTPINPQRRLPSYIRRLTGLSQEQLAEAPLFAEIVDELLEQLGGSCLVGHNIGFDMRFLNAELARLGRPSLPNPTLDTLPLAVSRIPSLRRPNLDAVAKALGVMVPFRHRADGDAAITAACFERLIALEPLPTTATGAALDHLTKAVNDDNVTLVEQITGLDHGPVAYRDQATALDSAAAAWPGPATRPSLTVRRGRSLLDEAWLEGIPARPGVYLMRDASGQIIYIGKAKNLKRRVRSYYSQPLGLTRKMDGLLEAVQSIDIEVVGSELEALLLESRLIKRELPRYNVQQRYFEHYPFIKIDVQSPYPRIVATRTVADDGARYFGPFQHASAVATTIELLTELFPVRTCTVKVTRPEKRWRPCLRLDLGQCLGPCVGQTEPATYGALIGDIVAYLEGRRESLISRLWQQLHRASERRDYERAARLRDAIGQVTRVTLSQQLLTTAVEHSHCLIVLPSAEVGAREVLIIRCGRLAGQVRLPVGGRPSALATMLQTAWEAASTAVPIGTPVGQATLDEIAIISRWLSRHANDPAILAPPEAPAKIANWRQLVAHMPSPIQMTLTPHPRSKTAQPIEIDSIDRFYPDE